MRVSGAGPPAPAHRCLRARAGDGSSSHVQVRVVTRNDSCKLTPRKDGCMFLRSCILGRRQRPTKLPTTGIVCRRRGETADGGARQACGLDACRLRAACERRPTCIRSVALPALLQTGPHVVLHNLQQRSPGARQMEGGACAGVADGQRSRTGAAAASSAAAPCLAASWGPHWVRTAMSASDSLSYIHSATLWLSTTCKCGRREAGGRGGGAWRQQWENGWLAPRHTGKISCLTLPAV